MSEPSFASQWGFSYSEFDFVQRFGAPSQVIVSNLRLNVGQARHTVSRNPFTHLD